MTTTKHVNIFNGTVADLKVGDIYLHGHTDLDQDTQQPTNRALFLTPSFGHSIGVVISDVPLAEGVFEDGTQEITIVRLEDAA